MYGAGSDEPALYNIDWKNMVVRYKDGEYPLYREAIRAFDKCATLSRFRYKSPNCPSDKLVYRARIEGDKILRGLRGEPTLLYNTELYVNEFGIVLSMTLCVS